MAGGSGGRLLEVGGWLVGGGWRQVAGGRCWHVAGGRWLEACGWRHVAGGRWLEAGGWR